MEYFSLSLLSWQRSYLQKLQLRIDIVQWCECVYILDDLEPLLLSPLLYGAFFFFFFIHLCTVGLNCLHPIWWCSCNPLQYRYPALPLETSSCYTIVLVNALTEVVFFLLPSAARGPRNTGHFIKQAMLSLKRAQSALLLQKKICIETSCISRI